MDEQAGPGVFFNTSGSSGLPGAGNVKAPQPGDGGGEAARAQYSIPGILHFLQHEWARFEVERAQWEVERAELQAQIAFLQGERRGQENLKKDLVRRIKMLEYALKQERSAEISQLVAAVAPSEALADLVSCLRLRYLQEVGYTDTILDVKSQRVRALLGLAGDAGDKPSDKKTEPMVNGTEPSSLKDSGMMVRKKHSSTPSSTTSDLSDDLDTEEALKGFDFLASPDELDGSPESRSGDDSGEWEKEEQSPLGEMAWDVDQGLIAQLKEQYRKERKGKKGVKRPNRSKLQDMLANLRDAEDLPSMPPAVTPPSRSSVPRLNEHEVGRPDDEAMTFLPSSGKSFILGRVDEAVSNELGLGELAGLTVANEAEGLMYDIANNKDALRKTWNPKFTLRSHFDSVRSLAFHPVEPVLVTASEDHTLKLWNLQKTAPAKKCAALDVEPIYTFRAHSGAVLCVTMSSSGEQCFSGGVDGTIQSWNTPNPNIDPYDSYEPSVLRGALCGHTDAVWGLVYSSAHRRLLSCSADGTVRLWSAADTCKLIHSMVAHLDAVTSLAVDPNGLYLMSGSHDCSIRLWNMESKTCIQEFTAHRKKFEESIHDVAFHPTKCYIGSAGADALAKVFV
ncbi:striatin-like [Neolamprologus brichardi]|uniref:striatin-like n=1 Tax=Neolamprologus brichardi TaxID=32507 RepID=UPI001643DD19|nr:striatin-like [Neolamprologus brichardi]